MPFIYKITSPSTDMIYIGATTRTLHLRFLQHKRDGNKTRSNEIIAFGDAVIELIEEVELDIMNQQERFYIESMREKCINRKITLRTQKEWRDANKDHTKDYHHTLYVENKEEINARNKLFYQQNREKSLETQRLRDAKNSDINKEKGRLRYANMEIITCECGSLYKKKHHNKHLKTKKHLDHLNKKLK
jgi:hypothetical protein